MKKIDFKKYYIEEHIFESYSNKSDLVLDIANITLSERLTTLISDNVRIGRKIEKKNKKFKVGEKYTVDYRKEYIPEFITTEPSPTDYHFLIILPAKPPKNILNNGQVKFTVMRLLNNAEFTKEIESWQNVFEVYKKISNDPETNKKIEENLKRSGYTPPPETQFDKTVRQFAERNDFSMEEISLREILIHPLILSLIKKYQIPYEYRYLIEDFIEKGTERVLENLSDIKSGYLSYLHYFGGIVYLTKSHDSRILPEIKSYFTPQTNYQHLKRAGLLITYFQKQYFKDALPTPSKKIDFDKHFTLYKLDQNLMLKDKDKAKLIFGNWGQKQIDKIKSMRRNFKKLIK